MSALGLPTILLNRVGRSWHKYTEQFFGPLRLRAIQHAARYIQSSDCGPKSGGFLLNWMMRCDEVQCRQWAFLYSLLALRAGPDEALLMRAESVYGSRHLLTRIAQNCVIFGAATSAPGQLLIALIERRPASRPPSARRLSSLIKSGDIGKAVRVAADSLFARPLDHAFAERTAKMFMARSDSPEVIEFATAALLVHWPRDFALQLAAVCLTKYPDTDLSGCVRSLVKMNALEALPQRLTLLISALDELKRQALEKQSLARAIELGDVQGAAASALVLLGTHDVPNDDFDNMVRFFLKHGGKEPQAAAIFARYLLCIGPKGRLAESVLHTVHRWHAKAVTELLITAKSDDATLPVRKYFASLALGELAWRNNNYDDASKCWGEAYALAADRDEIREAGRYLTSASFVPLDALDRLGVSDAFSEAASRLEGKVAVLVEPRASVPRIAGNARLAGCELVVYSSEDNPRQDFSRALRYGSFRDKVPDHSTRSHAIHHFAVPFADGLSAAFTASFGDDLQKRLLPYAEAISFALEDGFRPSLLMMERFDECISELADADQILVVLGKGDHLPGMLPYLLRNRGRNRVYITASAVKHADRVSSLENCRRDRPPERAAENAPAFSDQPIKNAMKNWQIMLDRYAAQAAPGYSLVAGYLRHPNYGPTLRPVIRRLAASGEKPVIYDIEYKAWLRREREALRDEVGFDPTIMTLSWLRPQLGMARQVVADFESRARLLREWITAQHPRYEGVEVGKLICDVLSAHVVQFGFYILALPLFFEEYIRKAPPAVVYASTSRMWQVRAACKAALENDVPVLDVQALNVLRHPKYRAPTATAVAVIDDLAREIHESYLGVPSCKIFVTGTPRVDQIRDETRQISRVAASIEIGFAPTSRPHIMFASQVQPIDRCRSILSQLCAVCVRHDCNLIVRLHPREGRSRIQAYERVIEECGASGRAIINKSTPIQRALAASDIVVTMFSNVAREALIAGKHVVIANYFDTELPLRFDKEGAVGAYSEGELYTRVEEAILRAGGAPHEGESDYFRRNPHLRSDRSEERIVAVGQAIAINDVKRAQLCHWPTIGPEAVHRFPFEELLAMAREQANLGRGDLALATLKPLLSRGLGGTCYDQLLVATLSLMRECGDTAEGAMELLCHVLDAAPVDMIPELSELVAGKLSHECESRLIAYLNAVARPSRAIVLFTAGVLLGRGSIFAARNGLEMLGGAEGTVPKSLLSAELAYLSAVDFDLQCVHSLDQPSFIVDGEAEPSLAAEWLRAYPDSPVYVESGATLSEIDRERPHVAFSTIVGDHSPELSVLIEETAVRFATDCVRCLYQLPALPEPIREAIRTHKAAYVAYMRVKLIDHARRGYSIRKILELDETSRNGKPVVVLAGSAQFVRYFAQYRFQAGSSRRLSFFACAPDRRSKALVHAALAENAGEGSYRSSVMSANRARSASDKLVEYLTTCHAETAAAPVSAPHEACCFFVVRSSLKTVAQTVRALLEKRPADIFPVLLSGDSEAHDSAFLAMVAEIAETSAGAPIHVITAGALHAPKAAARPCEGAVDAFWDLCSDSPGLRACGVSLEPFAYAALDRFLRKTIPQLFELQKTIERLLASAARSVVAVIPGRHGEALIAQSVANCRGVRSIDIQNAYMSSGYTYTRPAGNVVTAIDQWSADLFVRHFGVSPHSVRKVGTPRFDEIASLNMAGGARLPDLSLPFRDQKRPLVCFATQPGRISQGLRIVQLMAQVRPAAGSFNALIKLHPRESDEVLMTYRNATGDGGLPTDFLVTRDLDMYDVLAASEVVITIFSNVGVEAALMNKKLLIANLDKESLPLPLDEFEIGLNAYSDEDFLRMLCDLLDERGDFDLLRAKRAKYFSDNAHLLEGRSVDSIWSIIRENLAVGAL